MGHCGSELSARSAGDPLPQSREEIEALLGRWSGLGTWLGGASTGGRSDELQLELHSGSGKNAQRQHLREWVSLRINLWFSWVFFAHQFSLRLGAMDSLWAAQDRSI